MKKCGILFLCSCLIFLAAVAFLPVHGEEEIYQSVIRLHVLANSDSEEDQALKLRVRDAVLSVTVPLLSDCHDTEEARRLVFEQLDSIRTVAEETLRDAGCDQSVTVSFGEEDYPRRSYDSFCFPSGEYLSLRVLIGNAEGKNWWCCLFPPLCRGAAAVSAKDAEDAFISVGFTPAQYRIITESDQPVYNVRFKLLELFGK